MNTSRIIGGLLFMTIIGLSVYHAVVALVSYVPSGGT